jgi:hypothetical protein
MEVKLGSARVTLSVQNRGNSLGIMLQAAGGRYMLSDAVSSVELAADEFLGRVRLIAGASLL